MNFFKRTAALFLSMIITATIGTAINPIKTNASSSPAIVNNLVFFAQFADYNGNFMEDNNYTDTFIDMCNDTSNIKSFSGYINAISYGQTQTKCYFPQYENNIITPYQLKHSKEDYTSQFNISSEVILNVDVPEETPLDGNNDGLIDNIIIVIEGSSQSTDDILWPCKFDEYGYTINGLGTSTVNLHNTYSLFESIISGGAGVLCHEFLHSLGYPDLYRNYGEGQPVGAWDIMAQVSIFMQYPLAYQRSLISGWLPSETITDDSTVTLSPAASDSGNRVCILKTPLSDSEVFVVEYRQKGDSFSGELDAKIYGSGLIVYRVNNEIRGNYATDKDSIYVFRPNETNDSDALGDMTSSFYSQESGRTSVGNDDLTADISSGALVYSDGTNSGIVIDNIGSAGDTISFDVSFTDISNFNVWKSAGYTSEIDSAYNVNLCSGDDGTLYSLDNNGEYMTVCSYNGSSWSKIGTPIGNGSINAFNEPQLICSNNELYIFYRDLNYVPVLCKYNETSNKWENMTSYSNKLTQYESVIEKNGKIYIAYTIGEYPYSLNVACYDTQNNSYNIIGEDLCENACNLSIAVSDNSLMVAYRDLSDSNKPKAAILNGTTWDTLTISENGCGTVTAVGDGDAFWVASSSENLQLFHIDSQFNITENALPNDINSSVFAMLKAANGVLYLENSTQNKPDCSVYTFSDNSWNKLGNSVCTEAIMDGDFEIINNTIYSMYTGDAYVPTVKQYSLSNSSVVGDINFDNLCNVADMVLLQKHLCGITPLSAAQGKKADVCNDNYIDVFDMIKLQKIIVASV